MNHKLDNNTLKLFNDEEVKLKKFYVEQLPEESAHHESFIINENNPPQPWKATEKFIEYNFPVKIDEKSNISENECQIAILPEIQIPQIFTISSLKTFYSTCCSGASILPVYVKSCKIHNKSFYESEMYFSKLYEIYRKATNGFAHNVDYSIISTEVNSFIKSFISCFQKLNFAGADFNNNELLQILFDEKNEQNLVLRSKINDIYLGNAWKIKKQFSCNFMHGKF